MNDWQTASQVATTFGAAVGAGTLFSGFLLYRNTKRDAHAANFRSSLQAIQASCRRMEQLIIYDFANELTCSLVYSQDHDVFFRDMAKEVFDTPASVSIDEFLDERFRTEHIVAAIHTRSTEIYEDALTQIQSSMGKYQGEFPGLYRVLYAVHFIFMKLLNSYRRTVRSEKVWKYVFSALREDCAGCDSPDRLRAKFASRLTEGIETLRSDSQKNVDDVLGILDLTVRRYTSLSNRDVFKQSSREQRSSMRSMEETPQITDDLLEAERGISPIFSQDDLLSYRSSVVRLKTRYEDAT